MPYGSVPPFLLWPPQPGDLGWIVHRHGVLYAAEYGWNARFEALVADIVARLVETYDPARERCWIPEQDGAVIGSVALVRHADETAKLRLLYVELEAHGLGPVRRSWTPAPVSPAKPVNARLRCGPTTALMRRAGSKRGLASASFMRSRTPASAMNSSAGRGFLIFKNLGEPPINNNTGQALSKKSIQIMQS